MTEKSREEIIAEQKAQCPFCKIVSGEIPSEKIFEDDTVIAVSDINPAVPGHVLVMPKEHYPLLPLVPPEVSKHMFAVARDIARAAKKGAVADASSVFIANGGIAGQQATHMMLHVMAREEGDALTSAFHVNPNEAIAQQQLQLAEPLKKQLAASLGQSSAVDPEQKKQLAAYIEENEEFRNALIADVGAAQKLIDADPTLQELMKGVDLQSLHQRLQGYK